MTISILIYFAGSLVAELADHKDWVQGVTWDPLNRFLATQSKDRTMNVYSLDSLPDGGLKIALLNKNVKLTMERARPVENNQSRETSPSTSTSNLPSTATSPSVPSLPSKITTTQLLYSDEESTPFFRRLAFSPDGALLVSPSGVYDHSFTFSASTTSVSRKNSIKSSSNEIQSESLSSTPAALERGTSKKSAHGRESQNKKKGPSPTVYLYARGRLSNESPVGHLTGHKTTSVVVRFCPILWKRRLKGYDGKGKEAATDGEGDLQMHSNEQEQPAKSSLDEETVNHDRTSKHADPAMFLLSERSIYAVATYETIMIYDTQQASPICIFGSLHFAAFTDLAW